MQRAVGQKGMADAASSRSLDIAEGEEDERL